MIKVYSDYVAETDKPELFLKLEQDSDGVRVVLVSASGTRVQSVLRITQDGKLHRIRTYKPVLDDYQDTGLNFRKSGLLKLNNQDN